MDGQSTTNTSLGDVAIDQECWFADGNIVIIASGTTAFRVYKGLLTRISPVFSDLFSLPQAQGETEMMDGCPAVRVTDQPEAFRIFLSVFLKPDFASLFRSPHSPLSSVPMLSFATLAATIRIAHKYQADDVLEPAVARLAQFFAPGVQQWTDPQTSHTKRWELWRRRFSLEIEPEDSIEAVEILRLVGKIESIPFALYICCLCDPAVLRNGVKRPDGTIIRLSDEDFTRCIQGSLALSKECHIIVQRALEAENSVACTAEGQQCKESFKRMAKQHAVNRTTYPLCDVFVPIDHRNPGPGLLNGWDNPLCQSCRRRLSASSTALCRDLFAELPKFLSLETKERT